MSVFWKPGTRKVINNLSRDRQPSTCGACATITRSVSTRAAINQGIRKEDSRQRYDRLGGLFRAQRSDPADKNDKRRSVSNTHDGWHKESRRGRSTRPPLGDAGAAKTPFSAGEKVELYNPLSHIAPKHPNEDAGLGFSSKEAFPTDQAPTSRKDEHGFGSTGPHHTKTTSVNSPYRRTSSHEYQKTELRYSSSSTMKRSGYAAPLGRDKVFDRSERDQSERSSYPLSVPYTTAASEFLYGYGEVFAALKARSRKFYKIYIHQRGAVRDGSNEEASTIMRMAKAQGIKVIEGRDIDIRLLDKMSNGRPHNGVVLEASRLPVTPVTSLSAVSYSKKTFSVNVGVQSSEDLAINGQASEMRFDALQPVVLFIDDVLDPGNIGAILRSAYFLGIDAVILTDHCAPINPVALKASAGAAEATPLYRVARPEVFLQESAKAGWHSIAATTPHNTWDQSGNIQSKSLRYRIPGVNNDSQISEWASSSPKIIVTGGEGRGLRPFLTKQVHSFIQVLPQARKINMGIDSLNVSVATGLVCHEILTRVRDTRSVSHQVGEAERLFAYG